jgi:hypothetical protein
LKRRWKRRPVGADGSDPASGKRSSPVRRRVLMVAIVLVAAAMVYLLSERPKETGDTALVALDGKVYFDGRPLTGVRMIFEREERSDDLSGEKGKKHVSGISHAWYYSKTDADGRYHVSLPAGSIYTVSVRRPGEEKEKPLKQADGTLPAVDVHGNTRRFDIQLASQK